MVPRSFPFLSGVESGFRRPLVGRLPSRRRGYQVPVTQDLRQVRTGPVTDGTCGLADVPVETGRSVGDGPVGHSHVGPTTHSPSSSPMVPLNTLLGTEDPVTQGRRFG